MWGTITKGILSRHRREDMNKNDLCSPEKRDASPEALISAKSPKKRKTESLIKRQSPYIFSFRWFFTFEDKEMFVHSCWKGNRARPVRVDSDSETREVVDVLPSSNQSDAVQIFFCQITLPLEFGLSRFDFGANEFCKSLKKGKKSNVRFSVICREKLGKNKDEETDDKIQHKDSVDDIGNESQMHMAVGRNTCTSSPFFCSCPSPEENMTSSSDRSNDECKYCVRAACQLIGESDHETEIPVVKVPGGPDPHDHLQETVKSNNLKTMEKVELCRNLLNTQFDGTRSRDGKEECMRLCQETTNTNELQTNCHKLQTNSDKLPTNSDELQTNSDKVRTDSDKLLTNADKLQTNSDKLQVISDELLANSDKPRANFDKLPTNSDELQTNSDEFQTNSDKVGTNSNKLQVNSDKLPTNSDKLQANSHNLSGNSDKLQANSDKLQANSDKLPTNSDKLRANSDDLQANSGKLQTNSDDKQQMESVKMQVDFMKQKEFNQLMVFQVMGAAYCAHVFSRNVKDINDVVFNSDVFRFGGASLVFLDLPKDWKATELEMFCRCIQAINTYKRKSTFVMVIFPRIEDALSHLSCINWGMRELDVQLQMSYLCQEDCQNKGGTASKTVSPFVICKFGEEDQPSQSMDGKLLTYKTYKTTRDEGLQYKRQKPVALYEDMISLYGKANSWILDACSGTGSAALAALRKRHHTIVLEAKEERCRSIQERLCTEMDPSTD